MPYSDPLCNKCLHPQNLHTQVVSKLPNGGEIRRCTVAICSCILTVGQEAGKQNAAQAH
ncbi:MAG TPA: hypothetical protein VJZ68_01785 [Nitrososphaera sp.]|nr:hypothetical protein [Nitrososphaera sp.]